MDITTTVLPTAQAAASTSLLESPQFLGSAAVAVVALLSVILSSAVSWKVMKSTMTQQSKNEEEKRRFELKRDVLLDAIKKSQALTDAILLFRNLSEPIEKANEIATKQEYVSARLEVISGLPTMNAFAIVESQYMESAGKMLPARHRLDRQKQELKAMHDEIKANAGNPAKQKQLLAVFTVQRDEHATLYRSFKAEVIEEAGKIIRSAEDLVVVVRNELGFPLDEAAFRKHSREMAAKMKPLIN